MKKMFFSLVNSIFGLGLMVAGVVSGIWLIVVGDWWRLVFGVGFMFLSSLIIMIVPMPALIFSIPAIKYLDQGKKFLGMFFFIFIKYCFSIINFSIEHFSFVVYGQKCFREFNSNFNVVICRCYDSLGFCCWQGTRAR